MTINPVDTRLSAQGGMQCIGIHFHTSSKQLFTVPIYTDLYIDTQPPSAVSLYLPLLTQYWLLLLQY